MLSSKHITKISIVLISLALALCIFAMVFYDSLQATFGGSVYNMEYEQKLFDTDVIMSVDIKMDEAKWDKMLENPMAEEYYQCDVTVNGKTFYGVGIRPKGNTSLSSIANDPDNNRYSFKLEFDQFTEGQTCFGLDKLVLNNNFADTTNMKEAIVYDMYKFLGADAPLYNYAKISVNGQYWGVYLALEAVEESFMLRNYGTEKGYLYKPDNMGFGRDEKGGGGFGRGGSNLNYTNSNPDNYSSIWNSAVNESTETDHQRVVEALKNISERNNVEKYADVDNILKYMAVHNFVVNDDSLSGFMAHNYYLYEANGRLNIIPWDYNLSFGSMGMGGGSATTVINEPIDDSYQSTDFFDFVLDNDELKEKYHQYYSKLVEEYVYGGKLDRTRERIMSQIDELVKTDPNAMYTYDEYQKGAQVLYDVIMLRAKSVRDSLMVQYHKLPRDKRKIQQPLLTHLT